MYLDGWANAWDVPYKTILYFLPSSILYENNSDTDQQAHQRGLISAFVMLFDRKI